jgi:diaminopropionate ammonia-lyase
VSLYWVPRRRARPPITTGGNPRGFHAKVPGYRPTPLLRADALTADLGTGPVWIKFERDRFGLPAFKALGAFWAVYRLLDARLPGGLDGRWDDFTGLRALVSAEAGDLTLVTATDGNHGRAVARAAALFGLAAHVLVPEGTTAGRIDAIRGEGADVDVVSGDYDTAVAIAAESAGPSRLVVSDTSWPGYTRVPQWISEGYATLFQEIDEDLTAVAAPAPDIVIVPVGVGALAQAAINHYAVTSPETAVVAVEPLDAACVLASLHHGSPATVPGPHRSMMAGLNCGTPSLVAWPAMRDGLAGALAVHDDHTAWAMRAAATAGIALGESGAASLAGLHALASPEYRPLREGIGLGPHSSVVLLATETVTDPVNYARVVGPA